MLRHPQHDYTRKLLSAVPVPRPGTARATPLTEPVSMTTDVEHWASVAADWIAWVRTENHDAFWAYRTAFEKFLGQGTGKAVDMGCGEGRLSRVLQGLGYDVTAVEPVTAFLDAARSENSASVYIKAPAHAVPLPSGYFDLALLYNMLMDVDDLRGSLAEAARLVRPGGRAIVGLVHPFADLMLARRRTDDWAGLGVYWEARHFDDGGIEQRGLPMHFRGWMRPLTAYTDACRDVGLTLSRLCEPRPDPDHPWTLASPRWTEVPLFLWIEVLKPNGAAS